LKNPADSVSNYAVGQGVQSRAAQEIYGSIEALKDKGAAFGSSSLANTKEGRVLVNLLTELSIKT